MNWGATLEVAVKAYNTEHVHSAIQTTPEKARAPRNKAEVKENLEQTRVMTRRYPKLAKGDKVRLFHKKDKEKERKPVWSDNIYTVVALKTDMKQTFYKINSGSENYDMRSELLKIQ